MPKAQNTQERKRLVLIDAHAIIHRAYHALPDFASSKGEPTGGLFGLASMLIGIVSDLKPDYLVACFDLPQPTYRHEAYKDYKAGRKKTDDDLIAQIKRSRDVFTAFGIPMYDHPGFEADDMLGTIVEMLKDDEGVEVVIASGDMDTLQLAEKDRVKVYTLRKGLKDVVMYDEKAVVERFGFGPKLLPDYKGLRGDTSDNIIGIKGIGEKTATDLILNFGSIEDIYKKLKKDKAAFEKAGIKPRIIELLENGEEEAEFSKMLATIRRDAPIDFKLPEKPWRETVDLAVVDKLFAELEFRTMGTRMRNVLEGKSAATPVKEEKKVLPELPKEQLRRLGIALWLVDSNKTEPTLEEVFAYTKTEDPDKALAILEAEMEKRGVTRVYRDIELPLMPVVETMETWGIKIDVAYLKSLSEEYHAELKKLEKKIWDAAGFEFNIASPKQLGEALFDKMGLSIKNAKKTSGGARSTKESELMKLQGTHPVIDQILEHRELSKLLGTYIDTIPTQVDAKGRLHTTLMQAGTTTGRMSSHDPNLQNIPIKTEAGRKIRDAFIAEKGYVIATFDYSQIEIRVAAFLSGDEKLLEIFRRGEDVHTGVASAVFGVAPEKVDKEMRRRAKVINFGIMYGMGVLALKQNLGTDRAEAQKFYNDYFEKFAGLASYLDRVKSDAARVGYTETFFGRRRYFEGIRSKVPFIRAMAERMAVNAPIQGTEADVVKLALVKIDEYVRKEGLENDVRILLPVHDEILCEIKEDIAENVAKEIQRIMESVVSPDDIKGIVLKAEYGIGPSWGKAK